MEIEFSKMHEGVTLPELINRNTYNVFPWCNAGDLFIPKGSIVRVSIGCELLLSRECNVIVTERENNGFLNIFPTGILCVYPDGEILVEMRNNNASDITITRRASHIVAYGFRHRKSNKSNIYVPLTEPIARIEFR